MKKAILLINLGSPRSATKKDVKKYLGEFLMDKRVLNIPYLTRLFLVKGIILNTRPAKSAAAYQKVWTPEGSPLIVHSYTLAEKLRNYTDTEVRVAMRYAKPSIQKELEKLKQDGFEEILTVPLYPQYAMATTETVVEELRRANKKLGLTLSYLPPFYNEPLYIKALAKSIRESVELDKIDHLLFSYHGVPESHIKQTNPSCPISENCCKEKDSPRHATCYRHQCRATTDLVTKELGIKKELYSNSFQSRLGRAKWLEPYTTDQVDALAENGVRKLAVITPAFVADCLETLEEIGMELKDQFLEHNQEGAEFLRIDCLNSQDYWVQALHNLIENSETTPID